MKMRFYKKSTLERKKRYKKWSYLSYVLTPVFRYS